MPDTVLTFTGTLAAGAEVPVRGTLTQAAADGGAGQSVEVEGTLKADKAVPVTFTVDGTQPAADRPPSDVLRGFLQANAGIAAASVAIVAPLLIGLPNVRDAGLFQELRGLLFWMAVTVFVSVLAAIALHVVRLSRYHRRWPRSAGTAVVMGIVLTAAPAAPGLFALFSALAVACEASVAVPGDDDDARAPASRACGLFTTDVGAANPDDSPADGPAGAGAGQPDGQAGPVSPAPSAREPESGPGAGTQGGAGQEDAATGQGDGTSR